MGLTEVSMQLSHRRVVVAAFSTLAFVVCAQTSRAQQPEPLRLSSPPAHALLHAEPLAQAQTQTAQGELLDVDNKASTVTIKTETGEMSFRYNDATKVTGAQKGVSGLATMTGSDVVVMFQKDGQMNVATSIDVKGAPRK
jgi:hypothetical protein